MSLAFLILAHRSPAQVEQLFWSLHHRDDCFVLHFDRRAPAALHALGEQLAARHPNVRVLPSRRIVWGGPAMVDVQIAAMEAALAADARWTHFLNLTGQDFPLQRREAMMARLPAGRSYLSWFDPFAAEAPWRNARERVDRLHLPWPWLQALLGLPGIGHRLKTLFGWRNRLPAVPVWRRRPPGFFRIYGGANHVVLAREAAAYLSSDPAARRIRRWLRHSAHADELVFQSVLLNSPLAASLENTSLREIDFPAHAPHPRIFTSADLPRLTGSPALIARKFDPAADARVLETLQSRLA